MGRAVIAVESDDFRRRGELGRKVQDVPNGRRAKRIDRLSVITDDGHSPSARLEREDDRRLELVRVLILVDENMIEPITHVFREARIAEHLSPVEQEVVVIEHILSQLRFDISREQPLQLDTPGRTPRKSHAQDFFDREFGINATGIDREARPLVGKRFSVVEKPASCLTRFIKSAESSQSWMVKAGSIPISWAYSRSSRAPIRGTCRPRSVRPS